MTTNSGAHYGFRPGPAAAAIVGLAATAATVVLLQATPVWMALVVAGALVVCGSLVSRDPLRYWLTLFVATVPLNVAKMFFFEPDDLFRLRTTYGLIVNEIDVAVLYLSDLPLFMLVALLAVRALAERRRLEVPRPVLIAVAFTAWCVVSIIVAPVGLLSVSWILYQLKYLVACLAIVNVCRSERALRTVVAVLVFGLAMQGGLSLVSFARQSGGDWSRNLFGASEEQRAPAEETQAYLYVNEGSGLLRGSGTVGVSNETAKFLVPILPLAVAVYLTAAGSAGRLLALAALALGAGGLVCTFSRGGLIAAVFGLAVCGVLLTARGLVGRTTARAGLAGVLLALAVAAPVLSRYLATRPNYLTMRWEHLRYGWQALVEHPVMGVGINNFNVAFSPYDYGGVFREMAVHNHYLRIGVETGVPGLMLYVAFFGVVILTAARGTRAERRPLAIYSCALVGTFAGVAVYWLNDLFYSVVFNTQLWVLAALPFAVRALSARPSAPVADPVPAS
jgi:O-antigen ligase